MNDIEIRLAKSADLHTVLNLDKICHSIDDPDFGLVPSTLVWDAEDFTSRIKEGSHLLYLAEEGWVAGSYFVLQVVGEVLNVVRWVVHPHFREVGYEEVVLDWIRAKANARACKRIVFFISDSRDFRFLQEFLARRGFKSSVVRGHFSDGSDAISFSHSAPFPLTFLEYPLVAACKNSRS